MCNHSRCHACGQPDFSPLPGCSHTLTERHGGSLKEPTPLIPRAMTKPLLPEETRARRASSQSDVSEETVVTDEETIINRTPTKPLPQPLERGPEVFEFDFVGGNARGAELFELIARVMRSNGRLRVTIG
jgi:hypothetical protein